MPLRPAPLGVRRRTVSSSPSRPRILASVRLADRLARASLLAVVTLGSPGCQGPGPPKAGAPPHHLERGFRNLNPEYARPDFWTRWKFVIPRLLSSTFSPRAAFPVVENDGQALRERGGAATV